MGFMGLKRVTEVDGASDLKYSVLRLIQERFQKELEDPGNEYNPPGLINILLVLKEEPNLARYLSLRLAIKIDEEVSALGLQEWNNFETEIEELVRAWNNNPTVVRRLRNL